MPLRGAESAAERPYRVWLLNHISGPHAAETDQTHQAILEAALAEYLKRANA